MKKLYGILTILFFFACTQAKTETKYFEINDVSNISEIEFSTLADFEKFAVGNIFFCKKTSKVYVLVNETYYSYNLNGYKTIADFKAGSDYKNSTDYYEAVEQKIPDAGRFYFYKENKFKTGADALDAYANGYAEKLEPPNIVRYEDENIRLDNPISKSYYAAKELGIDTMAKYVEFLFLQKHGFDTMDTYKIAKLKGFKENSEYKTATEKGFETKEAWDTAKKLNLETAQEYKDYTAFISEIEKNMETKKFSKEECVIYHYLAKVPKDTYSLSKLIENVKKQMNNENKNVKAAIEKYDKEQVTQISDGDYHDRKRYSPMEYYVSSSVILKILNESKGLGKYNEKTDVFNKK